MAFPKKISDLPKAGSIKNSDLFVLVHDDVTSQVRFDRLIFSADSNTFVTGGTLTGTNLILEKNNDVGVSPIDLSALSGATFSWSDPTVTAGNTSGDCITQLWVSTISGCSPVVLGPEVIVNGEIKVGDTIISSSGITISGKSTTLQDVMDNGTVATGLSSMINMNTSNHVVLESTGGIIDLTANDDITLLSHNGAIAIFADDAQIIPQGELMVRCNSNQGIIAGNVLASKDTQGNLEWITPSIEFTGNTSGTCINELWVTSISGCSPVILGPAVTVEGVFTIMGDAINDSGGNTPITFSGGNTHIGGDIILNSNSILDSEENTCIQFDGGGNTNISGDIDVQGQILSGGTNISTLWGGNGGGTFTGNTPDTCIKQLYVESISGCSPVTLSPSVNIIGGIETTLLDLGTDANGTFLNCTDATLTLFETHSDTLFQIMDDPVSLGVHFKVDSAGSLYVKGDVGIGAKIPGENLHVSGESATTIKVESETANAFIVIESKESRNAFIDFKEDTQTQWRVGNHGSDDNFKWATGSTFSQDTVMTLNREGILNLPYLTSFSGDTAAGVGGLVTGDLWQTTVAHSLGVAGIVMIKQ